MKSLKALFKIRTTYIGIGAALIFQLIFFTVWMTAYDGIEKRTNKLNIGLINEDKSMGPIILQKIHSHIPFNIQSYDSIKKAKKSLDEGQVSMVIHIPLELTELIQTGERASINYWINESNATMTKTIMENTVLLINDTINKQIYASQKKELQTVFEDQLAQLPLPEQLASQVEASAKTPFQTLNDRPVEAMVTKVNDVSEFSANLVPLMIIISSFVGAMVMIMQHEEAVQSIKNMYSKWDLFLSRQIINFGVAIFLPIITLGLMMIFDITSEISSLTIYFFQFILYWAFLSFAQIFVLLFGPLGMVCNVIILALQLVTSGVLVPKELLSKSYEKMATILPASYGADGYYTIVFGGSQTSINQNLLPLTIIIGVSLLLSLCIVTMKKQRHKTEHAYS